MAPTHLQSYAPVLPAIIQAGADARAWLRELGVDPDEEVGSGRTPQEIALGLVSLGLQRLGRDFPVRCASALTVDKLGLLGFVAMTAPTLREALGRAIRYRRVVFSDDAYSLEGTALIREPARVAARMVGAAIVELGFCEHVRLIRETVADSFAPASVEFTHASHSAAGALEKFLGAKVRFGARRNALVITAADLDRAPRHANEALSSYFLAEAARAMPKDDAPLSERIANAVDFQRGVPRAADVARSVAMSERTLLRRLKAEGTTLKATLEEARAGKAREYLRRADVSIGEVAYLCGFSEPSAFHRAFRRWTGKTPAQFRADQQ